MRKYILPIVLIIVVALSSCGNKIPMEDQVSTALAETEWVKTVIAEKIAATMTAKPTNTSTVTSTPTDTPTETPLPTLTFTQVPTLPPILAYYARTCSQTLLEFDMVNYSSYNFRTWSLTVYDENNNSRTRSVTGFSLRTCSFASDIASHLYTGETATAYVGWPSSPVGHTMRFSLTVCTEDNICLSTGSYFNP